MNENFELGARVLLIGVGGTLVMDAWALLLRQFGIPSLNFALLGRWLGHLPEGRWLQPGVASAPPVRGERLLGWCAHYSIGIGFAAVLIAAFGLDWARSPSLLPALFIGVVTVVAPLFVLQPALGAGIASSKTKTPLFNCAKSLVTHTVYGLGLYLAALATAALLPVASSGSTTPSVDSMVRAPSLPSPAGSDITGPLVATERRTRMQRCHPGDFRRRL